MVMVKIKVATAVGPVLDLLVAMRQPFFEDVQLKGCVWWKEIPYMPSYDWGYGGPIKERAGIFSGRLEDGRFYASLPPPSTAPGMYGETELMAAMRCHVASEQGDEVEVPEAFLKALG